MLSMSKTLIPVAFVALAMLSGCAYVERVAPDSEDKVLSTTLGSKDIEAAVQKMARSIIKIPQIANAEKPPTVAFATLINNSSEPIETNLFLKQIRTLLMQHSGGKIAFLNREVSEQVLRERDLKRKGEITSSARKGVLGADFFLAGSIDALDKTDGKRSSTYTVCTLELTDAESMLLVWADDFEVKKSGKTGLFDW